MGIERIDFAPRRPPPLALLAAGALLLAAAAAGGLRWWQAGRAAEAARAQAQVQRAQLARLSGAAAAPAPTLPAEQLKAVNEAIGALNVPWPAVLGAVEASRAPGVALLRIEPRPKDRLLLVTAQADEMDALVAYMGRLARSAPFVKAVPVRQEAMPDGPGLKRQISFEVRWEERP